MWELVQTVFVPLQAYKMELTTVFLKLEMLFICSSASFEAVILTVLIAISNNKQLHSKLVMETSTTLLLLLFCVHIYF